MKRSIDDEGSSALVVSQLVLAARTKGSRPGFSSAAPRDEGKRLENFSEHVVALGVPVANGIFGADMRVVLANDGLATIWLGTVSS